MMEHENIILGLLALIYIIITIGFNYLTYRIRKLDSEVKESITEIDKAIRL
jgi:hypothetical protein